MGVNATQAWMDRLPPEDRAIMQAAFRSILSGSPPTPLVLASQTGVAPDLVRTRMAVMSAQGILVVDARGDQVLGAWGLSLQETRHRLTLRGKQFYTWCARDAVGLPAALDEPASIGSPCAHCGKPITLELDGRTVTGQSDPDVVIWAAKPDFSRSVVGFT